MSDTYTMRLGTRPEGTVTVTVASADTTIATVGPSTLTFTTGNWKTPQTITVTGIADYVDNASDRVVTIAHTSLGGEYSGLTNGTVSVTVIDDDEAGLEIPCVDKCI